MSYKKVLGGRQSAAFLHHRITQHASSRSPRGISQAMLPAWAKARELNRPLIFGECRGRSFVVRLNGHAIMRSAAPSLEVVRGSCLATVLLLCRLQAGVFGGVRQVS